MTKKFTSPFFALMIVLGGSAHAQTTMASWNMFGSTGPTATPSSNNAANNGKEVSAVGQTQAAFVSGLGEATDPVFVVNGWNVGSGNAWFLVNFATTGYSGNNYFSFIFETYQFGPKNLQAQYSTSSASGPWTSIGSPMTFASGGGLGNYNLLLPASTDNLANVWVRIVTTTAPTSTGGAYIDEIQLINNPPLPVGLASFGGNASAEGVHLQWVMENVEGVASYTIERSLNGSDFTPVTNMDATTSTTNQFTDDKVPNAAVAYYRLRVNNTNGENSHSQTVHFYLGKKTRTLAVAPNPANGENLEVQLSAYLHEGTMLSVTDMQGRIVVDKVLSATDIETGTIAVGISALTPGSYLVVINDRATNSKEAVPFVKN